MPGALPEALLAPITDLPSAKAWLDALCAADLSFHLEDSPETVINVRTDERVFRDEDCALLRERVSTLYGFEDWGVFNCPIGYLLAEEARRGVLDFWCFGDWLEYSNGQLAQVVAVGEGEHRHRAILKCDTGYMVAERDKELYAADDWTDAFEERELFPTLPDAIEAAGGSWSPTT
jgi:hypothetical protein